MIVVQDVVTMLRMAQSDIMLWALIVIVLIVLLPGFVLTKQVEWKIYKHLKNSPGSSESASYKVRAKRMEQPREHRLDKPDDVSR